MAAQNQYDAAFSAVADIQKRLEALEERRRTLSTLQTHRTSVEAAQSNAQKRLAFATESAQKLLAAQTVLVQTAKAQDQLEQWDRLAAIDQLRAQQAALERDLAEHLNPLLVARETLQLALNEDNTVLEKLRAERNVHQQRHALIEQRRLQARARTERFDQRLATVRLLGPDGVCETCGQTFGNTLDTALAHYAEERETAGQEEAQAAQEATALLEKEAALELRINDLEEARTEHVKQMQLYDEVPGEITSAQRTIKNLASQLAAYTSDERAKVYDAATHATLRVEFDRHSQAKADVARLQPIAETEPEVCREIQTLCASCSLTEELDGQVSQA